MLHYFLNFSLCCLLQVQTFNEKNKKKVSINAPKKSASLSIRKKDDNYFRGKICNQMDVIVEKVDNRNRQMKRAKKLRHPNFLVYHFSFKFAQESFIVKESFLCNIEQFVRDKRSPPRYGFKLDPRKVFEDISRALIFAKSIKICDLNINMATIGISKYDDKTNIYKIIDFTYAKVIDNNFTDEQTEKAFEGDVYALGVLLLLLKLEMELNFNDRFDIKNWKINDKILFNDVIRKLLFQGKGKIQSIEEISKHAFAWKTSDIKENFLKAAKILESESDKKKMFVMNLEKAHDVVRNTDQWTIHIDERVREELNQILQKTTKNSRADMKDGIFTLVKTIRNMVRVEFLS